MLVRGARRLAHVGSVALIGALLVGGRAGAEPPASQVSFSAQPSLFPKFGPYIHDYVVRCDDGPVTVTISASGGWEAAIDSGPFRRGYFSETVALTTGQQFTITVQKAGGWRVYRYHARCLPNSFPRYTFKRYGPVSPRFFSADRDFTSADLRYGIIFDDHGVPIWWIHAPAQDTRVLPDGNPLWANGAVSPNRWEIHRLDGSLVRALRTVGHPTDPHDLQLLGNGDYLAGAYVTQNHVDTSAYGGSSDADVRNAELQQVSPDGDLVWDWMSQDHISLAETGRWWGWAIHHPYFGYDVAHWNSIEPAGDSVIASFRHLDAVYKIRKSTGKIVWKLGGTTTPESLTVQGDPDDYTFGGQHDARLLSDGTLTVFDNRSNVAPARPRAVRFRVNEQNRTATLLESISDPDVSASYCCGSARRLGDGQWLIDWGKSNGIGGYGSDGRRTFFLRFEAGFSYRAEPVPNGAVSAQDLRQGMDAMYGF